LKTFATAVLERFHRVSLIPTKRQTRKNGSTRFVIANNALARNKLNEIALKASETQGNADQSKPNIEGTNFENENKMTPSKEHQASVTNFDVLWKRTD